MSPDSNQYKLPESGRHREVSAAASDRRAPSNQHMSSEQIKEAVQRVNGCGEVSPDGERACILPLGHVGQHGWESASKIWFSPHGTEWEAETYEEALEMERDSLVEQLETLKAERDEGRRGSHQRQEWERRARDAEEQLEALREAYDLELDELRMQVVGAENDLREAEAIVKAAREYVGEEPVQLWLNRGDRLVGALADPKWKRLVVALADSYPAKECHICHRPLDEPGEMYCSAGHPHPNPAKELS